MKEFEIMFGDLKPEKQDKFLTEMISVIKEKYDIDIYHSYDCTLDSLRIRMIDKNDNNINSCISYHDLCIITVDHFKYRLEEMTKQLLAKEKEENVCLDKNEVMLINSLLETEKNRLINMREKAAHEHVRKLLNSRTENISKLQIKLINLLKETTDEQYRCYDSLALT